MKQLQPVIWSKGTFLTPQHLQTQDRFIEGILGFHIEALNCRPWGFKDLAIDQEKLAEGQFTIVRASGLFSDSLAFDIPAADAVPASKPLGDFFEQEQAQLDVYLAVPDFRDYGVNVSLVDRDAGSRFRAVVKTMRDENTGTTEKSIQVAQKNLKILVDGEHLEGCSTLRVARVERTSAGTFRLAPGFVPPLLDVFASEFLVSILRSIVELLAAKSTQLSGLRRQKNQSLADFTASDIAGFWLLYAINSHLPLFNHLLVSKRGHPERLFSAMLSLAGTLTTFSTRLQPRDFPEYDHNDLGKCFADLNEKIRMLLETVVPSNFVALPLTLSRASIYATPLEDDKYLKDTRMYLAVSAEIGEGELIQKVPRLVKVCSASHIERLVSQALPGLQLRHMPSPPSAIPVKLNYTYFSLEQSGAAWEAVTRARNLAAYVPNDIVNPQLELLILLPQRSGSPEK